MLSEFDRMTDQIRSIRAVLSLYVGGALPPELTGTAIANGLPDGGWVFPPSAPAAGRHEDLSVDLADAGLLLREHAEALGVQMLVPGDPGWPAGTGADDLPCLWVTGNSDVAGVLRLAITVAGAHRSVTSYGAHVASDVSVGLAEAGWTIVASAHPTGIAASAARAARAVGGLLLLVAACGHDRLTTPPAAGAGTASRETVVSPCPPGSFTTRGRFGVQHRLLGTFSRATVIVEAAADGQDVAAAREAAEAGRLVCAVPGPVTSAMSRGCHDLITSGSAHLVTGAAAVLAVVRQAAVEPDLPGGSGMYWISGVASWDDGRWRSRQVPGFHVQADDARTAADHAYEIVFAASDARGTTLDAGVIGPDGSYEAVQVSSTS